jgi:hypothetical protein
VHNPHIEHARFAKVGVALQIDLAHGLHALLVMPGERVHELGEGWLGVARSVSVRHLERNTTTAREASHHLEQKGAMTQKNGSCRGALIPFGRRRESHGLSMRPPQVVVAVSVVVIVVVVIVVIVVVVKVVVAVSVVVRVVVVAVSVVVIVVVKAEKAATHHISMSASCTTNAPCLMRYTVQSDASLARGLRWSW